MIPITTPGRPPAPLMLSLRHWRAQQLLSRLWPPRQGAVWVRGARAAAAKGPTDPAPVLHFRAEETGEPIFSELLQPGKRAVLVGVDPDTHGAVAVLSWQNPAGDRDSSNRRGGSGSRGWPYFTSEFESIQLSVHDMPIDVWELGKRSKRQPDPAALLRILRQEGALGEPGDGEPAVVRAVLEHTTPQHLSGKYAWYGMGYSFGLLTGVLTSQGIPHHRVDASVWKRHMGLYGLGKEGSLGLAKYLFPQAEPYLRRKMDHGRAEAILIAAWGLGVRAYGGTVVTAQQLAELAAAAGGDSGSGHSVEAGSAGPVLEAAPKRRAPRKKAEAAEGEGEGEAGSTAPKRRAARKKAVAAVPEAAAESTSPRKRQSRKKAAGDLAGSIS